MALQHSGSFLSPKLSSGLLSCLCVTWLCLSPLHLFKAQIATDLTQIYWPVCLEWNNSGSNPSAEGHSEEDDDLTSLAEHVMRNPEVRREEETEQ